jgi:hypothetical protein
MSPHVASQRVKSTAPDTIEHTSPALMEVQKSNVPSPGDVHQIDTLSNPIRKPNSSGSGFTHRSFFAEAPTGSE